MPYKPVSANDRFIPAQIQQQNKQLNELETLTGGQVRGKLAGIQKRAQIDSGNAETSGWTESRNNWVTAVTLTFTVPDSRTTAHVLARYGGTIWIEGNWSGAVRLSINDELREGALTPPFLGIQSEFIGIGSTVLNVDPGQTITLTVQVRVTGTFAHIPDADGRPMPNEATLDTLIAYT